MQAANNRADPDTLLTEVQAADFLNLSVRTLQAWRIKMAGRVSFALVGPFAIGEAISSPGSTQIPWRDHLLVLIRQDVPTGVAPARHDNW